MPRGQPQTVRGTFATCLHQGRESDDYMETSLYYTFSTISQTLAGAVALLGGFLVYYVMGVDRSLDAFLGQLYSYYPRASQTVDLE